jgi:diguanylate cyclase (GGDEF)-like protein
MSVVGDPDRLSLLESVLGAIGLGAVVLDSTRRVVLWNHWMARHSGLPAAAVLGCDFFVLFPELRDERIQQAVAVSPIAVQGAERHCLIQISDVSVAVGREKLLREQTLVLRSQSFADGLTGIANRRHFDVAMEKESRRAKRNGSALSLLMIDIDYFKAYNDHYGHQQGDACLTRVAGALAAMLNRPTDLLARYGGEEFAAILPDTDCAQAHQMAESIRHCVIGLDISHQQAGGAMHQITVSIGVATQSPANPVDVAQLIGAADRALYAAKRSGRNQVVAQARD